jgi:ubiquinol-cytochrome c reductase cytochrome c subunit
MKTVRDYGVARRTALVIVLLFLFTCAKSPKASQTSKPSETPSGNAENGKQIFNKDGCYECHGREGQGSYGNAPRIAPDPIPFDAFTAYIRKPKGEMPPYTSKVISDRDLADIYAFLRSRSHPPAVKSIPLLQ